MTTRRVLVLGGGYAGTIAALRLSRDPALRVTLVDARPTFTQRIRNHELLAGRSPSTFEYAKLLGPRGVDFVQGWIAELDPNASSARVRTRGGASLGLEYDGAVLALGSRTAPEVPGAAAHAVTLDDPDALRATAARLATLPAGRTVLVIGSGLSGIETSAEIAARHGHLRVILLAPRLPGSDFSERGARHLLAGLRRLGVHARTGLVEAIDPGTALLADGERVGFDLCVWAAGFVAAPLAAEAGLAVDAGGRALVDETLAVRGRANLVAAGDAAAVAVAGRPVRMGCVAALPMGAHAAATLRRTLSGHPGEAFRFAFPGRNVSLGRRDGLTQLTRGDDSPVDHVLTGRPAALIKESICRMTIGVLRAEARLGLPLYLWPRGLTAQPLNPTPVFA